MMNPAAWLRNFDDCDKKIAAMLLDRFSFYNDYSTNLLLKSSWNSISDGLEKGPSAPIRDELIASLENSIFVPVNGEVPSPTDSGYLFCRKARQVLGITDDRFHSPSDAIEHARKGTTIVFLDDFVGSGDQFIDTWQRAQTSQGEGFLDIYNNSPFPCIYMNLVTTEYGYNNIANAIPHVALCSTHILTSKSTIQGLIREGIFDRQILTDFLTKYTPKLRPSENYIANNPSYLKWGYKERGLMLGFEHSIPDATLPIFWSTGIDGWEPLIERA